MVESSIEQAHVPAESRPAPACSYVEAFGEALRKECYSAGTIKGYLRAAESLSDWLQHRAIAVGAMSEAIVEDYVAILGRRPRATRSKGQLPVTACAARKFFRVLCEQGIVERGTVTPPQSAADEWLGPFAKHLDQVAGVSDGTRRIYLRYARAFLARQFGVDAPKGAEITSDDVMEFIQSQAARLKPSACNAPATAIRAFLRFLVGQSLVSSGLQGAAMGIRQWKMASLPKHLSADQVDRIIATCDETTATGRRDRAILLLLAHLGLRAGEVVNLRLEDFDWSHGQVLIRAAKTGRERSLPLPHDVGVAVASYLRKGRPKTASGAVFLRCRPPYGPIKQSSTVSARVKTRMELAGICANHMGAHSLRHSAATHMVNHGMTFKEVADILGHRQLQTTSIYAKLDLERLAAVALPWMEVNNGCE
jgi:integrase/recombinase XerD